MKIDGIDFSREDFTRVRFALQSCQTACAAASKEPGDRQAIESNELNSIMSRFVALIEMGSEGTTYEVSAKDPPRGNRKVTVIDGPKRGGRLPGLGG